MKALIIGNGRVGQALSKQIIAEGGTVWPFDYHHEMKYLDSMIGNHEIVLIATPSVGDGSMTLRYIKLALHLGKKVVICEKSALAYHFAELKPHLGNIGYLATVGGGSGMLRLLQPPTIGIRKIIGIVNGTLNFIYSRAEDGYIIEPTLKEVERLGLCEKGKNDLVSIFNTELMDIRLKLSIIFNLSGVSEKILFPDMLKIVSLSREDIKQTIANRLKVMISIDTRQPQVSRIAEVKIEKWYAGIYLVGTPLWMEQPPKNENCALSMESCCGQEMIYGVGAGPTQTASIMLCEAKMMLGETK